MRKKVNGRYIPIFTCIISSTLLSICAITILQDKALAWFEICNKSSQKTYATFAYFDAKDNRDNRVRAGVSELSPWISEGWWILNPGQCTQVYPHELWRRNRYYYVYAESDKRRFTWSGNHSFCIAQGTAFTIRNADLPVNTSSPGQVANGCYIERNRTASIKRANFIQVDIGNGRTQNFTFDLR